MSDKDGGPAFPNITPDMRVDGGPGMSLRDYFAIHCDQPGMAEIATAAGLPWKNGTVVDTDPVDGLDRARSFDQWWSTVSQAERFELYAKVRYAMADAMLAARQKGETT
jgi:hypothetical protein